MKKVLLFPYNIHSCDILRYCNMLTNYEIIGVLAPSGWGMTGKDAGFVDGGKEIGMKIQETIDYEQNFQGILVAADGCSEETERVIADFVEDILSHNKEIIFLTEVSPRIKELCSKKPNLSTYRSKEKVDSLYNTRVLQINTPVIAVAGTHEFTNKFKIQMELNQFFKEKGYKVSHIASKQYGELFGIHSFPDFMYSEMNETNKIFGFNKWIRQIEKTEQPDVILIGIPGEIMPYSEKFPGHFGIMMYECMQAVRPDVLILSCLYDNYNVEYFEKLSKSIRYKYGVYVDCFNISTFQVDLNESEQNNTLQYFKLRYQDVDRVIASCKGEIPIFNIMNDIDGEKMADLVLQKLQEYSEAEFV